MLFMRDGRLVHVRELDRGDDIGSAAQRAISALKTVRAEPH
jgi:hypothetical protein